MARDWFLGSYSFYRDLLNDVESHDVQFKVGEATIGAHKLIMEANSAYFVNLWKDGAFEEAGQHVFEEHEVSADAFKLMVEFAYTRKLRLSDMAAETIAELLIAANRYQVLPLFKGVKNYVLFSGIINSKNFYVLQNPARQTSDDELIQGLNEIVERWQTAFSRKLFFN